MNIRTRKFIGAFLLMALAAVWSLLAMSVAQFRVIQSSAAVAMIYYAVVGIGWVLPAMPIVKWMQKP